MKKILLNILLLFIPFLSATAQVGDYRNDFAIGFNGGYTLSSVGFSPKVQQNMLGGTSFGFTMRYTCEKYLSMICSIQTELNFNQLGWKENILDLKGQRVLNPRTNQYDAYQQRLTYIQLPIFCHLAFGQQKRGANFFINMGPQFGYMLSSDVSTNFSCDPEAPDYGNFNDRASKVYAQDTITSKNKFDYGISVGAGVEINLKKAGHITLDARYYLGLGNLYPATKADFFGKSNNSAIEVRLSYLFDIVGRRSKEYTK